MVHAAVHLVQGVIYKLEGRRSLDSFIYITLPAALSHGVDSTSDRNEYQKYLLEQRRPVHRADNLIFHAQIVVKSESHSLQEPFEPVLACTRIALLLCQDYSWLKDM